MKVELTDADMQKLAEMVTNNFAEKVTRSAMFAAHYEALVEKGKEVASRMYGNISTNDGVHQVLDSKVAAICREDLRYVIRGELEKIMGDNDKLQRLLFSHLLDGVVDKARSLAYRVNCKED